LVTRPCSSKTALGHSCPVWDADRPQGRVVRAGDDHRGLGRAEAVPDRAAEALGELLDVAVGGLVAEGDPQRVVLVVGLLGSGQDVGQRLADVVEVRRAVAADVVEEVARAELRQRQCRA
jgi:hypothetical protein